MKNFILLGFLCFYHGLFSQNKTYVKNSDTAKMVLENNKWNLYAVKHGKSHLLIHGNSQTDYNQIDELVTKYIGDHKGRRNWCHTQIVFQEIEKNLVIEDSILLLAPEIIKYGEVNLISFSLKKLTWGNKAFMGLTLSDSLGIIVIYEDHNGYWQKVHWIWENNRFMRLEEISYSINGFSHRAVVYNYITAKYEQFPVEELLGLANQ